METKMKSDNDLSGNCGDIYRLAEELKMQERKIMDFSTPSNPLGVSKKIKTELRKHLKYLHTYPDPEAERLKKRLAQYYDIAAETILCGSGSTELIHLLARVLKPRRVLIPAPTFPEYERACYISCSPKFMYYRLREENNFDIDPDEFVKTMEENPPIEERQDLNLSFTRQSPPCDMVFLCNPNNPTGRLLKRDDIRKIADAAKKLRYYLIVDEAFIDFCPDDSVIKDVADNPYLIVLRSMSSFYALSGLRLGYGVFPPQLGESLKRSKEPWTVNSLAQRAAVMALKDKVFRKETFRSMQDEKKYLEKHFRKIGMEFLPSAANFYLVKIDSAEVCLQLRKKGILLCDCSHFRGLDSTYRRIAVKSHKENAILIKELTKIFSYRG